MPFNFQGETKVHSFGLNLLLQNQWVNFNQIWHKTSLNEGNSSVQIKDHLVLSKEIIFLPFYHRYSKIALRKCVYSDWNCFSDDCEGIVANESGVVFIIEKVIVAIYCFILRI